MAEIHYRGFRKVKISRRYAPNKTDLIFGLSFFFCLSADLSRPIIQSFEQFDPPAFPGIIESFLSILCRNFGQLVHSELDVQTVQVLQDAGLMHALGDNAGAPLASPGQDGLGGRTVLGGGHIDPEGVLHNRRQVRVPVSVGGVEVSQRRVGDDLDAQGAVPGGEQRLLQVRVRLVLVGVGSDLGVREQVLELAGGEVGHPDVPGQVGPHQLLHRPPRGQDVGLVVQFRGMRLECHGPVHQVQVQVGCLEVREGLLQGRPDQVGPVVIVPQFRGGPVRGASARRGIQGGTDVFLITCIPGVERCERNEDGL